MARVSFSALIEAITGKLAGSVFQDSYQGFQIRTRVIPRNPRTQLQQLRRGEFGFITQTWRTLTPTQRATWIDAAPPGMQGINFYVQSNVNLIISGSTPTDTFTPGATPIDFPLVIASLAPPVFTIVASTPANIVPAGFNLVLSATPERPQSQLFTNDSSFSVLTSFASGSDFSAPDNIAFYWNQRFGDFTSHARISIKTFLINGVNGSRGPISESCEIF